MIPLLDLQAQYASLSTELDSAVLEVLRSGNYVQGRRVASFERTFSTYCGATETVAVNTGTSALQLALLSLGIGPGDEVVTVPMTFVATAAAVLYTGARCVLADVDPETWTLAPEALERAITPRTRAILPVHLHGRMADMDAILAIAGRHGIPVIEDAAQAHGAEWNGRRAGTAGAIGCFSFYPGKNLGACGEGGAAVTDRPDLAARMRQLRDWGQDGRYNHVVPGFNYRLDEIQGAVLDVKLRRLEDWTTRRRAVAATYDQLLAGSNIPTPQRPRALEHVYHVYAIRTAVRDDVAAALRQAGISTGIHYPRPVHLQPAYADLGYREGDFPVSEALSAELLSLPIFPELTVGQVERICDEVRRVAAPPKSDRTIRQPTLSMI